MPDRDDEAEILADVGFREYIRGGTWRALGDANLERLIKTYRVCLYGVCLLLFACTVALCFELRLH